jgi:hypothetical protein
MKKTICMNLDHQISKCHGISENIKKGFSSLDPLYDFLIIISKMPFFLKDPVEFNFVKAQGT